MIRYHSIINKLTKYSHRLFLLLTLLSLYPDHALKAALPAGPIIVTATPDTNQIRIGEQVKISLKANIPTGVKINFPLIPDTFDGIEVVSRSAIDTVVAKDKSSAIFSQSLQVTSFDSGYYVVEPFHFTSLNNETGLTDTFSTEAFLISVKTIQVDTTLAIKDIKAPLTAPLTLMEILSMVGIVLLCILVLWFLWRLWKNRKNVAAPLLPSKPKIPAYQIALDALKKTEQEKLWQQGFYKKYHSEISDTLREYIERSYDINALELTSDETLDRIRRITLPGDAFEKLRYVLTTADPVKFAKMIPMPDENERSLQYAYDFVNLTRPIREADINRKENEE
ncbi:MAG TPA: hypothetical protein PKJ62_04950 [Bacteroidia bacterium]|nr:hypothetical protein [Bacteroidia bacterium]HNS13162.1 hypothetical protein [Bacteroidia bacterium]